MTTRPIRLSRDVLEETGIPKKFWPLDLSSFCGSDVAVKACVRYIQKSQKVFHNGVSLFLFGPVNSGKTFLGTFILKCILVRGFSVKYTTLPEISRDYVGDGETAHTLKQLYLNSANFLFVDDISVTPNKAERNGLERVLKMRLTAGCPTILAAHVCGKETMLEHGPSFSAFVGMAQEINTESESAAFAADHSAQVQRASIWGNLLC